MPNPQDDTMIARVLVDTRLMTQEEVNACKRKQAELARKGEFVSLADICVQEGFITQNQMDRISKHSVLEDSMTRSARHIPGYHIISKLGQGAMATVWKARQLSLERIDAIKILPKRLSGGQTQQPEHSTGHRRRRRPGVPLLRDGVRRGQDRLRRPVQGQGLQRGRGS
jgi:hypothetical protein